MTPVMLIGLGGILGATCRYWVSQWAADRYGVAFPYGTLLVNASGSFAIGAILALLTAPAHDAPELRYLLITGFLGGYTTFSTFAYETVALLRQAELRLAIYNIVGSTAAGVVGTLGGAAVGGVLAAWLG